MPLNEAGVPIKKLGTLRHEVRCANRIGLSNQPNSGILKLGDSLLCMISSFIDPFSDDSITRKYVSEPNGTPYEVVIDVRRPFLSLSLICRRWFHVTRSASSLCPVLRLRTFAKPYLQFAFNRLVHRNLQVLDLSCLPFPPIDPTCARNDSALRNVSSTSTTPPNRLFNNSFDHWENRIRYLGGAATVDEITSTRRPFTRHELRALVRMWKWYNMLHDLPRRWEDSALVSLRVVSVSFQYCDQRGADRITKYFVNTITSCAPNLEHLVFVDGTTGTCDPSDSYVPSMLEQNNGALAKKLRTFCVVMEPDLCHCPPREFPDLPQVRLQALPEQGIRLPAMRDFSIVRAVIGEGEIRTVPSMAESLESLRIIGCCAVDGQATWLQLFSTLAAKAPKLKKLMLMKNNYGDLGRPSSPDLDAKNYGAKEPAFGNPLDHLLNWRALEELHLYATPKASKTSYTWPQFTQFLIAMPNLKVLLFDNPIHSTKTEINLKRLDSFTIEYPTEIYEWLWLKKQGWEDIMAARKNRPFDVLVLRAPSTDSEEYYPEPHGQSWREIQPNPFGTLDGYWAKLIGLAQYYATTVYTGTRLRIDDVEWKGTIARNFGWFSPHIYPENFKGSGASVFHKLIADIPGRFARGPDETLRFYLPFLNGRGPGRDHGICFACFSCGCPDTSATRVSNECSRCFYKTFILRNGPYLADAMKCVEKLFDLRFY